MAASKSKRGAKTTELGIGLVGTKFMGRAHANAWRQAPCFFDLSRRPRLQCVAGRDRAAARAFAERWEGIAIAAGIDGQFAPVKKATSHAARAFVSKLERAKLSVSPKGAFSWEGSGVTLTGVATELDEVSVLQFTATNDNAAVLAG
jgi:hypothetical protein